MPKSTATIAVSYTTPRDTIGIWNGAGADFVEARVVPAADIDAGHSTSRTINGKGRLEIVSANGRRIIVEPDVEVAALLRIIRGLESLR
jgi:transposase